MIHYIIEWTNGTKESIYGFNYINALRLNGITPEMEHNIIESESINIIGAIDRFLGSIGPFNEVVYHTLV